ncbi:Ribonuclease H-like domain containing protein [Trema orientale]|uniref:Ribonuclease H-like domain containing protein n=1 Tax=Trema orientale TaxID=63057 RepID=A0A2P5EIJ4_TREOI|nr:Ribonuclease H-like domain containing protein [Trema orientale]
MHERLKFLLWRIATDLLPTGERLGEFYVFATILCEKVWHARNSQFHTVKLTDPQRLLYAINALTGEHVKTATSVCETRHQVPNTLLVNWLKPTPDRKLIHIDAAFRDNKAAAAAVCRGENNSIIVLATTCFTANSPLEAELKGLHFGLLLCRERGWLDVSFLSDSMEVVTAVKHLKASNSKLYHVFCSVFSLWFFFCKGGAPVVATKLFSV